MSAEDPFAGGDIVKDNTGENPVEDAENHEFQYQFRSKTHGPSRQQSGLL